MPGDGTYPMGGVDGKDWGFYQSTGGNQGTCSWSVRRVNPDAGADILDSGEAAAGETSTVNIQPDGHVSIWDGTIDGSRIVFMTNNCGAWQFQK